MSASQLDDTLRQAIKAAVAEVFEEKRNILHEIMEEIVEDIALARAMDEAKGAPEVGRSDIVSILEERT